MANSSGPPRQQRLESGIQDMKWWWRKVLDVERFPADKAGFEKMMISSIMGEKVNNR